MTKASANQGTATKWLDVTEMRNWYGQAGGGKEDRAVVNMFVCEPRRLREDSKGEVVFDVRLLERHPYTLQTFIPMGLGKENTGTCYLVIVAPTLPIPDLTPSPTTTPPPPGSIEAVGGPKGSGPPDLDDIQAFIARGDQAVTYGPGTWHAPMVVLGEKPIEFVVVQYANGVANDDCQEFEIDADVLSVEVSGGGEGETQGAKARL